MFRVKKATTLEHYCPNGHEPLFSLFPETNHSVRFCPICGQPTEERSLPYDAPYCANCDNRVDPCWICCPHCGRGRDDEGKPKEEQMTPIKDDAGCPHHPARAQENIDRVASQYSNRCRYLANSP